MPSAHASGFPAFGLAKRTIKTHRRGYRRPCACGHPNSLSLRFGLRGTGAFPLLRVFPLGLPRTDRVSSASKPEAQAEGNRFLNQHTHAIGSRLGLPGVLNTLRFTKSRKLGSHGAASPGWQPGGLTAFRGIKNDTE